MSARLLLNFSSLLALATCGIHCSNSEYKAASFDQAKSMVETDYNPQLSYLYLVLAAAAYATDTHSCYTNSHLSDTYGQLTNITREIVPASHDKISGTWSGFVARLPKQQITIVSFRGTIKDGQLLVELLDLLRRPMVVSPIGGRVQAYFYQAQLSVWSKLEPALKRLRAAHPADRVAVTGHSLGAAMATLCAAELAAGGAERLQLYTFGEPRVGDVQFAAAFDRVMQRTGGISWRVVNGQDLVVHLPPCRTSVSGCNTKHSTSPYHHGTEVFYPNGMRPETGAGYRICRGHPTNEDRRCSNSPSVYLPCLMKPRRCIEEHERYFGIRVGEWWLKSACQPTRMPGELMLENVI